MHVLRLTLASSLASITLLATNACFDLRSAYIAAACELRGSDPHEQTATAAAPVVLPLAERCDLTLYAEGSDFRAQGAFTAPDESEYIIAADVGTEVVPTNPYDVVSLGEICDGDAVGIAVKYYFDTYDLLEITAGEEETTIVIVDNLHEHDWSYEGDSDWDD